MRRDRPARLLVFRVGEELFAVELGAVIEVVDAPEVHDVPEAPAVVLGVTTLHDQIVTAFDAHRLLRVGDGACGAALVFEKHGRRLALCVTDVLDTVEITSGQLRSVAGMDMSDGVLQGVVRRDDELIAVVDADALIGSALAQAEDRNR